MTTDERPTTSRNRHEPATPEASAPRGRIVVGIDGSNASRNALRTAFLEAVRRGGDLEVVSTYADVLVWTGGAPIAVPDQRAVRSDTATRTRSAVEEVLDELIVEDVDGLGDVGVRRIVDGGEPAPVLVRQAEGAELLVVGSRGRRAVASALLGSVALHCVTRASCPVLVVHGNAQVHPSASAAVVVGMDGSDASVAALREAVAQAARLGCRVEVLATYAQEHYWTDVYLAVPPSVDQIRTKVREQAERAVDAAVAELSSRPGGTAPPISVTVVEGSASEVLVDRSADASMLVVGSRGHGPIRGLLLGSVALHCVIHAQCPVLVVHPQHETAAPALRGKDPVTAPL